MTVEEYRQKFIELFEQLEEEHGHLKEVRLKDETNIHWRQCEIGSRWIECSMFFY